MRAQRIVINAKDIAVLFGISISHAHNKYAFLRQRLRKQKGEVVTIGELCHVFNIPIMEAKTALFDSEI